MRKLSSHLSPAVLGLALFFGGTALAQTKTAQSAMFDNQASGNFIISGETIYVCNKATAATYFTNTWNGLAPTVNCAGNPTNCGAANRPATPPAPAPDSTKLNSHISNNACNFWNGTALTLTTGAHTTYTQFVTAPGNNANGNWKFTYTYNVGLTTTAPVTTGTAWDIQSSSSTNAEVSVTGFFAGQSTQQKNNGSGGWSFKASQTITDSIGASRLVDATAKLLDSDANVLLSRRRSSPPWTISMPRTPAPVEFSEFHWPFCQKAQPIIKELLAKYRDQVSLAFRDFPLRQMHPQAQMAAEASRCADEQGKFWEYHDLLFANPARLDPGGLKEQARSLGLDESQFKACLEGGRFKAKVEEDLQEGMSAGVTGAPGFFINGIFISGAQPVGVFEKVIEAELATGKAQTSRSSSHHE